MRRYDMIIDINEALQQYPSLKRVKDSDEVHLEGKIIFTNAVHGFDDWFNVAIKFPQHYPYQFPCVEEIDNRIPKVKERHVNSNGYLCFGAEPEELIVCNDGINLSYFLKNVLIPHLAREVYVEIHRNYPHGERPHYKRAGNMDFYYETLRSKDAVLVLKSFCHIACGSLPKTGKLCYCGSGTPYFDCHESAIKVLQKLPATYIISEINAIYGYLHR